MKRRLWRTLGREYIFENGSYKLVALFVTLILWITILGRRDVVLSKDLDLEFLLPRATTIGPGQGQTEVVRHVTVKVSGPRSALSRFTQNPGTVTIDLERSNPGPVQAVISSRTVDVPFGVKVLSVTPNVISVNLIAAGSRDSGNVFGGYTPIAPPAVGSSEQDSPRGEPETEQKNGEH